MIIVCKSLARHTNQKIRREGMEGEKSITHRKVDPMFQCLCVLGMSREPYTQISMLMVINSGAITFSFGKKMIIVL